MNGYAVAYLFAHAQRSSLSRGDAASALPQSKGEDATAEVGGAAKFFGLESFFRPDKREGASAKGNLVHK